MSVRRLNAQFINNSLTIFEGRGAMFYYIDQLRTPSFSGGLVKTKSDFIVRPAQGDEHWYSV